MADMDDENRKRLGLAVVARRTELGMRTTKALADRADLTPRMLSDVEKGRRDNFSPGSKAQIERALQWQAGSIDAVLAGGEPTPIAQTVRGAGLSLTPSLTVSARISQPVTASSTTPHTETMMELSFLSDDLEDAAESTELFGPITDQHELDRYVDEVEAMRSAAECLTQAVHKAAVAAFGDVNRLRHAKRERRRLNAQGVNIKSQPSGRHDGPVTSGSSDDSEPATAADAAARAAAVELKADRRIDDAK